MKQTIFVLLVALLASVVLSSGAQAQSVDSGAGDESFFAALSLGISIIALLISFLTFWFTYLKKSIPLFACSKWTAMRMIHTPTNTPRAAFSIYVNIANKSKVPLTLYDFVLKAEVEQEAPIFYEPLFLWDLAQWIEDGNHPERIGRAQKGQVPLPVILPPDTVYDFGYSVLFLPLEERSIDPSKHASVKLTLFALVDPKKDYVPVCYQVMGEEDLKVLLSGNFSGAVSTASKVKRHQIL